jgi:hypothetical protein
MGGCGIVSSGLPVILSDQTDEIAGQNCPLRRPEAPRHLRGSDLVYYGRREDLPASGSQSRGASGCPKRSPNELPWKNVPVVAPVGYKRCSAAVAQQPDQPSMPDCAPDKTLADYQSDIEACPKSSLAYYCIAELFLKESHYQASVNAYRGSLRDEGIPCWTKVRSYVQIGKVFDLTNQRERAVSRYR